MQRTTRTAKAFKGILATVASIALAAMMLPLPALAEVAEGFEDPTAIVEPAAVEEPADVEVEAADEEGADQAEAADAEAAEDDAETGGMSIMAVGEAVDAGPFKVVGEDGSWTYEGGILKIHSGSVTVSTEGQATEGIVIDGNCTLTLDGVDIAPSAQVAAITVNPDVAATLALAEGTVNTVTGGPNHAGVQVSWASESQYGNLIIEGPGTLSAKGGSGTGGAGIGGSYASGTTDSGIAVPGVMHGNIIIKSGTVTAQGTNVSAGIGTSRNPNYGYVNTKRGTITIDGGTVNAYGNGNASGIGGGRDAGATVVINGGTIHAEGDSGIGTGLGSSSGADKGPGWVWADITINGGDVTAYATNNMGAGIGGGMYGDAIVTINGGTVTASVNTNGKAYQGAAGIGGGYQGCGLVTINGGSVTATGGNGCPGIGDGALAATYTSKSGSADTGWSGSKSVRVGKPHIEAGESGVVITGGTVVSRGGYGAAGIGSGNCSEWCNVEITGGNVTAIGYPSSEDVMEGGAGIGSGTSWVASKAGYMKQTTENIAITGGTVVAIGGWGAAGIGSGSHNETADSITIDAEKANVQAYSDGTKSAIDTPQGEDAGSNAAITGNVLQSTFVHVYRDASGNLQGTEGLKSIIVRNEATGEATQLVLMPDGYRSFATDVPDPGAYAIFTDSSAIGESGDDASGAGAYFSVYPSDTWSGDNEGGKDASYGVVTGTLSDYSYLFPVKTVVVDKEVVALDHEDVAGYLDGLNETFYFAIADYKGDVITGPDGNPWVLPIEVVDGMPQNDVFFANMNDGQFEVWETDSEGNSLSQGTVFGDFVLKKIRTRHGEGTDNNAELAPGVWTDRVTVVNSFLKSEDDVTDDPTDPGSDDPVPGNPTPGNPTPGNPTNPGTPGDDAARPTVTAPAAPLNPPATPGLGTTTITDDATPLARAITVDSECWVHWLILLGILVTLAYGIGVAVRRKGNSRKLDKLDDGMFEDETQALRAMQEV